MQLSGIGPTTASAIVATVGKGHDFTCGRQFCARRGKPLWFELTGAEQRAGIWPSMKWWAKCRYAVSRPVERMGDLSFFVRRRRFDLPEQQCFSLRACR